MVLRWRTLPHVHLVRVKQASCMQLAGWAEQLLPAPPPPSPAPVQVDNARVPLPAQQEPWALFLSSAKQLHPSRLPLPSAVEVEGTPVPLPFQQELWALAQASHESWRGARLPPGCAFYNLHGAGISTPYDVQYGSWWLPLQVCAGVQAGACEWRRGHHRCCAAPC